MAETKLTTPGGCRIFHDRTFQTLQYDVATKEVRAHFRDGSVYIYEGVPQRIADDWIDRLDPGCFFNNSGKPWKFRKEKGPD